MKKLKQTALVTGCGRKRLGYVIAKQLATDGYNIAVHYHRSQDSAKENASEFRSMGVESETYAADVTQESEVRELVAHVVSEFETIDVLITTASIWNAIPLPEVTADDVWDSFRVNTLGTFLCCQHVGMVMTRQPRGGNIVTIGDSLIDHPYVDHAAYFTAKGAIPTLTKSFAVELAARNPQVRVNCIQPGPVMFPESTSAKKRQLRTAATLSQQADHPQSVANAISCLIRSPMMVGCILDVDGGRNVGREQQSRILESRLDP